MHELKIKSYSNVRVKSSNEKILIIFFRHRLQIIQSYLQAKDNALSRLL